MTGKTRSRNYPALSLQAAIDRARDLYRQDGKAAIPAEVAVKAWKYGSLNGASLRVLGALRQYGLLDDPAPKTVRLSPRALTILLEPEESPARANAIREAATAPAVFGELMNQYGSDLPSDIALVSHLVRNENFSEDAARNLIVAFRDTLELLGKARVDNSTPKVDIAGGNGNGLEDPNAALRKAQPGLMEVLDQSGITKRQAGGDTGGVMQFQWPLSGSALATLTVSKGIEPDDVETLAAYLEIAKRTLAKVARTSSAKSDEASE